MQKHDLIQGSPQWLAHRETCWNASDAPAMMGCSPFEQRSELVRRIATGITPEVDAATQRRFDDGHRFEALARPRAEPIVGDDLSPLSGSIDAGLSRPLAASFDGLTFMCDKHWEHKSLNDELRAILPASGIGDESIGAQLPLHNRIQLEQQAAVCGSGRALFTASKWRGEELIEERHCWYRPDPKLRAQILAGWRQFEADVAAYKPAEVVPAVVAEPVQALPAVLVKVTGEIAITANFGAFETALRDFLDHRLIREPKTDQDFADLDLQIKAMKGAEAALDAAETQMLAQIQTVDTAKKTKDMLANLVRTNRLMAEKLLESEKARRKAEIVSDGQAKLRQHVASLTARVGVAITVAADFPGVIKGKKSLTSMEDAIGTELARAKIEASRIADLIDVNNGEMVKAEAGHLFPDFASVCTKPTDDFANLIVSRRAIAQARLDAERERIRAEEAARLEREAAATKAREEAEAKARADAEARAAAQEESKRIQRENDHAAALRTSLVEQQASAPASTPATARVAEELAPVSAPAAAPAPEVRAFTRAAPANEQPTMTLGQLGTRLGFNPSADFLASLGFVAHKDKASRLYRPSDFRAICEAISAHVLALPEAVQQAA